uniref:Uncharacterized protein n=1 Tax=Strigops habroptila TaxID=2489341 RepID=A0A672UTS6_STRHB
SLLFICSIPCGSPEQHCSVNSASQHTCILTASNVTQKLLAGSVLSSVLGCGEPSEDMEHGFSRPMKTQAKETVVQQQKKNKPKKTLQSYRHVRLVYSSLTVFREQQRSVLLLLACFLVPSTNELFDCLISKQRNFMSFLRQRSCAKFYVLTQPYFHDSEFCHIEGFPHQAGKVLSLTGMKFKELFPACWLSCHQLRQYISCYGSRLSCRTIWTCALPIASHFSFRLHLLFGHSDLPNSLVSALSCREL